MLIQMAIQTKMIVLITNVLNKINTIDKIVGVMV